MSRYVARCHDCGWESDTFTDLGPPYGLSPDRSAKASKAGHLGGQRKHYNPDPCDPDAVEVVKL